MSDSIDLVNTCRIKLRVKAYSQIHKAPHYLRCDKNIIKIVAYECRREQSTFQKPIEEFIWQGKGACKNHNI